VTAQSNTSSKMPLVVSLSVLAVCLLLGGGFIWWYLGESGSGSTVKLSVQDVAALQSAGQQLTFRQNGGSAVVNMGRPGTGGPPVLQLRSPPDPDGVFPVGNFIVIRSGQTLVRVQPAAGATTQPTFAFRQRTWGLLQDAPSFTVARRVVHEDSLAHQLAVTHDQLTALAKVVSLPPLKGEYLTALPVSDSDLTVVATAWTHFMAARAANDKKATDQARSDLLQTARDIGAAALARAKKEYADADNAINQALNAQQMQAYREGKTLAP
jgi:hypothetical protein